MAPNRDSYCLGAGTSGSGSASTSRKTVLWLTVTQHVGQTGAGPACQGQSDRGQSGTEPLGSAVWDCAAPGCWVIIVWRRIPRGEALVCR